MQHKKGIGSHSNQEENKKKLILEFLSQVKESTVARIRVGIKANAPRCKYLLNILLQENKILVRKEVRSDYYMLPNHKINHGCGAGELPQHHHKFKNDK